MFWNNVYHLIFVSFPGLSVCVCVGGGGRRRPMCLNDSVDVHDVCVYLCV